MTAIGVLMLVAGWILVRGFGNSFYMNKAESIGTLLEAVGLLGVIAGIVTYLWRHMP